MTRLTFVWPAIYSCIALLVLGASPWASAAPPPVAKETAPGAAAAKVAAAKSVGLSYEFEAHGHRILVDRRPQQLRIESEKRESVLGDRVQGNSAAEVAAASTPLRKGDVTLARLAKGRKLYITAVEGEWSGTNLLIDGQPQAGWVRTADLKPLPSESRAFRHLQNAGGKFVSAAMLVQKAKQFDDGLYAAVELAAADGAGKLPAKSELLRDWAAKVHPPQGAGLTTLLAAGKLGGVDPAIPAAQQAAVADLIAMFQADAKLSKPLGFYTWSPQLEAIFRQDRMLQRPIDNLAEMEPLVAALRADKRLAAAYVAHLSLFYRLTNPPLGGSSSDLLPLLVADEPPAGIEVWHIAPASVSHETQLFLRLFADRDVPEGFQLMPVLIEGIRAGKIDLAPTETSGWYDHQTWALQPLLLPEKMPEASHLVCGDEYRKHLEELFKGTLALTRETHVKQLDVPPPAAAAEPEVDPKPVLVIQPQLDLEPLATFYLRRAQSYAFVRTVLTEALGEEALAKMHRQTQDGPVAASLAAELSEVESLFRGAHVVAARQLGRGEDAGLAAEVEQANTDAAAFLTWAAVANDPDISRDARMMVPVHTDAAGKRIKVWCLLGWEPQRAWLSYAKQPGVSAVDASGKAVNPADKFEVVYGAQWLDLASPIFAEVWVTKLLNRDEFRRHCDTYVTPSVILANLE